MDPFLKWAGGKRWLLNEEYNLFPKTIEYNKYIEPFLGGGAVFFHLRPSYGILSDINTDLINCYQVIRDNWEELYAMLVHFHIQHNVDFYYRTRESTPRKPLMRAARFLYLNRTCWNGLYRVNQRGKFNVPIGTKSSVVIDDDNFPVLSEMLNNVEILSCDFEQSINRAQQGDFLFIDPPYTVKHNLNGFVKYNEKIFSWDDQIRLKNSVVSAKNRGVQFLILNANHESIRSLYQDVGIMTTLKRASVIAGNTKARGIYTELAIKSYII